MKRSLLAAALALPVIGLGVSITAREAALRSATEWRIPVAGYDPRDPIRGRYIQFGYAWRLAGNAPALCRTGVRCALCLEASGGAVTATYRTAGAICANRVDTAASAIDVVPVPVPVPGPIGVSGAVHPQFSSRIFVSEASAPRLDAMLRKQPMVVVARLTNGGRLVNQRLEPAAQTGE